MDLLSHGFGWQTGSRDTPPDAGTPDGMTKEISHSGS
jgi:hypothetical protein